MADDADIASEQQERILQAQLDAALQAARSIPGRRLPGTEDCEKCGELIEEGRLRVLPYTKYCSTCANEVEHLRARGLI
jgi:RNA polymerase-binding transcription factor DksA